MSQNLPTTQRALLAHKDNVKRELVRLPVPAPAADEVLIKNVAVASNPKDWKKPIDAVEFPWPGVEGNDVAGDIVAIGQDVKGLKVGDKVAAFTKMVTDTKYGTYQEYTVAPAHQTFLVSQTVSYEDASTLPLAVMTAAIGLFRTLALPTPPNKVKEETWIFVNGGSSSVGHFALQLAKLAGLKVATTAGASRKVPEDAGADVIVDYRGKTETQVAQELNAASDNKIRYVFDAIASESTQQQNFEVLRGNGGAITVINKPTDKNVPSNVTVRHTYVATSYGVDAEFSGQFFKLIGELLNSGALKPNTVKVIPGGLSGVDEGLKLLQAEKVSGVKLVYRIAETPEF